VELYVLGGRGRMPLGIRELLLYLAQCHPILAMEPAGLSDEGMASNLERMSSALLQHGGLLRTFGGTAAEALTADIDRRFVQPGRVWVLTSTLRQIVARHSPSARPVPPSSRLNEKLRLISQTLAELLQQIEAATEHVAAGALQVPFWVRLKLSACKEELTLARQDITNLHHALLGDLKWTKHLYTVLLALARGEAVRSQQTVEKWLSSIGEHVAFLLSWQASTPGSESTAPFRLGSVSDIAGFFCSVQTDLQKDDFHIVLEPAKEAAEHPETMATRLGVQLPQGIVVENLILLGASWHEDRIVSGAAGEVAITPQLSGKQWGDALQDYECPLPRMRLRPMPGQFIPDHLTIEVPLIVAASDASNFLSDPVAMVVVRTELDAASCVLRGVRVIGQP